MVGWSRVYPPQRERLVYNMDRLHVELPLDHVISIGFTDCGFESAIASRMFSIPFSVFATYQDTLCYHSLQPQEVDLCVSDAFRVATTNPHVLQHIHAFHPVEETSMLIDPRPDRSEISRQGNTPKPQSRSTTSYVVTTGSLDQFVYLPDLVARILEIAAGEDLSIWQHVGSCCPVARSHIEVLLATEEGPTFLNDFEVVARSQYVELVSDAVIHVIPQRKSDTNSAAYESKIWGVPTDYPSSHCFPSLGQQSNSIRFGTTTVKLSGIESLAEDIAR